MCSTPGPMTSGAVTVLGLQGQSQGEVTGNQRGIAGRGQPDTAVEFVRGVVAARA